MWTWFFSICVYWLLPNGLTKMLPAIALALETPHYWIQSSMLMASLGDLCLEVLSNPVPGIIMFAGVHINIIYHTQSLKYIHYYTMIPLTFANTFLALQFEYHLNAFIWIYSALLSILLSSSITLQWQAHILPLKSNLFLGSVMLFIISDLFVAAELLALENVPAIGVFIYWTSLALLIKAF